MLWVYIFDTGSGSQLSVLGVLLQHFRISFLKYQIKYRHSLTFSRKL
nr:MAG TPA: hypothetical protein [Bacteriophage sp.]